MSDGILTAVDDLVVRHGANGLHAALSILKAHRPLRTLTQGEEAEGSTAERQRDFIKRIASLARDNDSSKRWVAVHLIAHAVAESSRPLYLAHRQLLWDVCAALLKRSEDLAIRSMALECLCALVQRDRALRDQGNNLEAVSNDGKTMSSAMDLIRVSVAAVVATSNNADDVASPTIATVADSLAKLTRIIQTSPALAKSLVKRVRDVVNPLLHHESKLLREKAVALLCALPHCVGGGQESNWACLLAVLVSGAAKCTHKCASEASENAKLLEVGEQGLGLIDAANKSTLSFYQPIADWESTKTGAARVSEYARRLDALCSAIAGHLHGQGEAARARTRQQQQRQNIKKNVLSSVAPTPAAVPVVALLEMMEVSLVRDTGALLNNGMASSFAVCPSVVVSVLTMLDALLAAGRSSLLRHLPQITAFSRRLLRATANKQSSNPYAVPQVSVAALRLGERLATTWNGALEHELATPFLEAATRELRYAQQSTAATSGGAGMDDVSSFESKIKPNSSAKSTRKHKAKFRTLVTVEHDDSAMQLNPENVVERLVAASDCITAVLLAAGCNVDGALRTKVDGAVVSLLQQRGLASAAVHSSVALRCALLKALHTSVVIPESGMPRSQALVSAMKIMKEYSQDPDTSVATSAGLAMATCSALIHPRGASLKQILQGPNLKADTNALRALVPARDAWEHVPIGGPVAEGSSHAEEEADSSMVVDSGAVAAVVVVETKPVDVDLTGSYSAKKVDVPSKKRGRESEEKQDGARKVSKVQFAAESKPIAPVKKAVVQSDKNNEKKQKQIAAAKIVVEPKVVKPVVVAAIDGGDESDDDDDESLPSIVDEDPDL